MMRILIDVLNFFSINFLVLLVGFFFWLFFIDDEDRSEEDDDWVDGWR
ncbi:MAG TPA: hypothetical protein VEP90_11380 [Methylomirabilota bacterium]|nr:hypothetical protein [Methylomirabilota bacterium]